MHLACHLSLDFLLLLLVLGTRPCISMNKINVMLVQSISFLYLVFCSYDQDLANSLLNFDLNSHCVFPSLSEVRISLFVSFCRIFRKRLLRQLKHLQLQDTSIQKQVKLLKGILYKQIYFQMELCSSHDSLPL